VTGLSIQPVNDGLVPFRRDHYNQQAVALELVVEDHRPVALHEAHHRERAHAEHARRLRPLLVEQASPRLGSAAAGSHESEAAHGRHRAWGVIDDGLSRFRRGGIAAGRSMRNHGDTLRAGRCRRERGRDQQQRTSRRIPPPCFRLGQKTVLTEE